MKRFLLFLTVIFAICAPARLYSQDNSSGVIKGKVTDAVTGETLIGANVVIEGTSFGAASNLDGEFTIYNLKPGTYNVTFRYLGYEDIDKNDVQIAAGQMLELNGAMSPASVMGEEIIITAQIQGQRAAINQQRSSSVISNIVSSDKIKEVPDINAAESIGRLPGVAIQRSAGEGNKVVVRGLDPKYTNIKIDGVRLSGTGGDRSVGLTSIAPEMLDGIELTKSLTADKEADALAGEINLRTKVAASGFHVNGQAFGNYNGLEKNVNGYRFSVDAGNRFFDDKLGVLVSVGANQIDRRVESISNNYGNEYKLPNSDEDPFYVFYYDNSNININETLRKRINGNVTLDYKTELMQLKFRTNVNRQEDVYINRNNTFVPLSNDVFRYNINDGKPISLNQLYALQTEFKIKSSTLNIDGSYTSATHENQTDDYNFVDPSAFKAGKPSKNDLYGVYAKDAIQEFYDISEIDRAYLITNLRDTINNQDKTYTANLDWKMPYSFGEKLSGYIKIGGMHTTKKRKSDTERIESYYHGGIGVARTGLIFTQNPDFLRPQDIPGYSENVGIPAINYEDKGYDYGEVLKGEYELGWSADMNKLKQVHNYDNYAASDEMFYKKGIESNAGDYETTETYNAAYIMAQIKIGQDLMILPGIRYEHMQTQYLSNWVKEDDFAPSGMQIGWPVPVELTNRKNANWFPSVNMKYDVFKWMDIRASYYKSTTRPNFSQLSPGVVLNNDGSQLRMNNPYLMPGTANNYDLGVSFFTNKLGLFTVNVFYKELYNLQETIGNYKPKDFNAMEGAPQILLDQLNQHITDSTLVPQEFLFTNGKPTNAQISSYPFNIPSKAYVKGLELAWQTNFWYLPGLLSGLVLDLNVTFIESQATYPYLEIESRKISKPPFKENIPLYKENTRKMNSQPGTIYNARVGWDYKGFSTRVSFRYEDQNILEDNLTKDFMRYRDELLRVDLNLQYKITNNFTVSMDIANLNNAFENVNTLVIPANYRRGEYGFEEFPGDQLSKQYYGMQAQVGVRFKF